MKRAFTLIEMMVVIGIVALLAALAVPAFNGINKSSTLTTASHGVIDRLNLARQTALARNCSVEVRFCVLDGRYRAMLLLWQDGRELKLLEKPFVFPASIIISDDPQATTILAANIAHAPDTTATAITIAGHGSGYDYRAFRFKSSGATDLPENNDSLHLTLVNSTDAIVRDNLPANYVTIQIDPATGRIVTFRP